MVYVNNNSSSKIMFKCLQAVFCTDFLMSHDSELVTWIILNYQLSVCCLSAIFLNAKSYSQKCIDS